MTTIKEHSEKHPSNKKGAESFEAAQTKKTEEKNKDNVKIAEWTEK